MADLSALSDAQLRELRSAGGDLSKLSDDTLRALRGQPGKIPAARQVTAGSPSDIPRHLALGVQGVSDSVADLVGGPGDLVNWGGRMVGALPEDSRSPVGSETFRHGLDQIATVPGRVIDAVSQGSVAPLTDPRTSRLEPNGAVERAAYQAGHGGGTAASMLTGIGAVSRAARPGGVTQRVAAAASEMPRTQVAVGAGSGAIGGASDNPLLALGSAIALPSAYGIARNALAGVSAPFTEQGMNRLAAQLMVNTARRPREDMITMLRNSPRELVPGSPRTTAEVLNNAGVAGLERGVRNDPLQVQRFRDIDETRFAARDAQLGALPPAVPPEAAGAGIRGPFEAKYGGAQTATRQAYGAVDKTGQSVDVTGAYTRAAQHVSDRFGPGSGGPPDELTAMLGDLRASNVPLGTVENIRSRALALAQRSNVPGPNMDARVASAAREIAAAADEAIGNAASGAGGTMDPAQRAALFQARQARAAQGEFERSPVGKTMRTEYGEHKVPDAMVPQKVFHQGPTAGPDGAQFRRLVGDDPDALQSVKDYAVTSFRQAAFNQRGEFVAESARRWLKSHGGSLRAFPEVNAEIRATISPVLADVDSARFARDAGRSIGSNTVQNQLMELGINNATSGIPIGSIPGVAPILRRVAGFAGGNMEGTRERLARMMADPDEAAAALAALGVRPPTNRLLPPQIALPAMGEAFNNRR